MAFVYIKAGGTADGTANGVHATQQTGSFAALGAANYYSDMAAAFAQGGADDVYCVSDANSLTSSEGNVSLKTGQSDNTYMYLTCVSDTNIDQEVDGTGAANPQIYAIDWTVLNANVVHRGLYIKMSDDMSITGTCECVFDGCKVHFTAAGCILSSVSDGKLVSFINTDLQYDGSTTQCMSFGGGSRLEFIGGSFSGASVLNIFHGSGIGFNGGATIKFLGVDMSGLANPYYLNDVGSDQANDDSLHVMYHDCKLNSTFTGFVEETIARRKHLFEAVGCANASADSVYQFHLETMNGSIEDDTATYLTATEAVFGATEVSAKVVSTANATIYSPFRVELPWVKFVDLTAAASDVMRIKFASNSTLTPEDIWFDVVYMDDVDNAIQKYATSRPTNIWGSTSFSTTTSEWTGSPTNEYYVDIDLSDGELSAPRIFVTCAIASATVYIDPAPTFN